MQDTGMQVARCHKEHGVAVDPLLVLFEFFFFMQKTAYEIPLCDWSSDVCSSDLTCGSRLPRRSRSSSSSRVSCAPYGARRRSWCRAPPECRPWRWRSASPRLCRRPPSRRPLHHSRPPSPTPPRGRECRSNYSRQVRGTFGDCSWNGMSRAPRVYISAGEPSGDAHAAAVVSALKRRLPAVTVEAFGGPDLEAAGAVVLDRMERFSVVGFVEALWKLPAH